MTEIREAAGQATGDKYATWDAAYVLGSLSQADRHEFEDHLNVCAPCRRAVGELAGMPALLRKLDLEDIDSFDEPGHPDAELPPPPLRPEVLGSLLDTVRRRRRRSRLVWAGGCAAAAAAVAIGVFVMIRPAPPAPGPERQAEAPLTMTAVEPSPLTATVNLVSHAWGTGIEMSCLYGPGPGGNDGNEDKLAMVAVGRDGSHTRLATWMAHPGVVAKPAGATALPIDQIASVQIISTDTGDVLVQRNT
jgi:hypothetical protein